MNNHGLGHLPQPDNFTTVGNKLGIEINQYNCPINVGIVQYSTVQYSTLHYSTVQLPHQCGYSTVQYSTVQSSAVQYNCPINVGTGGRECRLYLLMLPLLQAYSENSIEEMREQKEKGGMDNLEMFGIFVFVFGILLGYFRISHKYSCSDLFFSPIPVFQSESPRS